MNIVGIIPCRFSSTRFPGKPLAKIGDKPMMWHVYQRAIEANILDKVYIATDDVRIFDVAKNLGLNVLMTKNSHKTGTDRLAEASEKINANFYINIQGDEPFISPDSIRKVAKAILKCKDSLVKSVNAYTLLTPKDDVNNHNFVKVTTDIYSNALSFSRSVIPYPRSEYELYKKTLGLYAFRKSALDIFLENQPGPIEKAESIEMLRILEFGYKVLMVETSDSSIAVDTPQDLEKAIDIYNHIGN